MVSDLNFLAQKWCKISAAKKGFVRIFCSLRLTVFLAPTSQSLMSKLFWYSESLRKNKEKKWSQIWTFLLKNGVKLQRRKGFLWSFFICSLRLKVYLPSLSEIQCPFFFRFKESFGKSYGKKWSQIVKLLIKKGLKSPRKKKKKFLQQIVFFKNLSLFYFLVIYHLSPVTCHLSTVTCQLSPTTCYYSDHTWSPRLIFGVSSLTLFRHRSIHQQNTLF